MGIFDKLFKNNNDEDNKYVLFASMAIALSASDGDFSTEEALELGRYLSNVPGMTAERQKKIITRADKEGLEALKSAKDLTKKDKLELINFLIGIATSDGYFHGEEAAFIVTFTLLLGYSKDEAMRINDHLFQEYKIDLKEFEIALQKRANMMKNKGLM